MKNLLVLFVLLSGFHNAMAAHYKPSLTPSIQRKPWEFGIKLNGGMAMGSFSFSSMKDSLGKGILDGTSIKHSAAIPAEVSVFGGYRLIDKISMQLGLILPRTQQFALWSDDLSENEAIYTFHPLGAEIRSVFNIGSFMYVCLGIRLSYYTSAKYLGQGGEFHNNEDKGEKDLKQNATAESVAYSLIVGTGYKSNFGLNVGVDVHVNSLLLGLIKDDATKNIKLLTERKAVRIAQILGCPWIFFTLGYDFGSLFL